MSTDFEAAREALIEHLRRQIRDEMVLRAIECVPRELFIPIASRHQAYEDRPLPIDLGQTISQPFIVALMTEALELKGGEVVLEIGTGSGYQAAILAELARKVITVERHQKLAEGAKHVLDSLGYTNIEVHVAERTLGWCEGAPYDAIIVTAGAPNIPIELLDQLAIGGRMVIPVGSRYDQEMVRVYKTEWGAVGQNLGGCRFVPLVGEGAWDEE